MIQRILLTNDEVRQALADYLFKTYKIASSIDTIINDNDLGEASYEVDRIAVVMNPTPKDER